MVHQELHKLNKQAGSDKEKKKKEKENPVWNHLVMAEVEPNLYGLWEKSGALENLPNGRSHSEERIQGDDGIGGDYESA